MNLELYPWQEKQWTHLANMVSKDRLPHALLLAGPDGLGLESFATVLAAYLLCQDRKWERACGRCRACMLIQSGNHPDHYRVEPEEIGKQIKVDEIRELINFIHLSSQYASHRIAVLYPAEAMNRNAANALLKTLEEPPADGVFVLVTTRPARLPVTIRSRCQRINFPAADAESGVAWLVDNAGIDAGRAGELLSLSQGRPLTVIESLETEQADQQSAVLDDLARLVKAPGNIVALAQKWNAYGGENVLWWLMQYLQVITRLKVDGSKTISGNKQYTETLQQIANQLNLAQLVASYDMAMRQYRAITGPYNLNATGLLEDFIIHWQSRKNLLEDVR